MPTHPEPGSTEPGSPVSRRSVLKYGSAIGSLLALSQVPAFTAQAAPRPGGHPATPRLVPEADALALRYGSPAAEDQLMREGLPIGNGRLGAVVSGHPSRDVLSVSDITLWSGGANDALESDGQFPYDTAHFGSYGVLVKAYLEVPGHDPSAVSGYRRRLDLSNGLMTVEYELGGTRFRREVYCSHPDDVIVVRLTRVGGGTWSGRLTLTGTRGEPVAVDPATASAGFAAKLDNGLAYAAVARAATHGGGTVGANGSSVTFEGCDEVLLVLSGGTSYSPGAEGFIDRDADPRATATARTAAAAKLGAPRLLAAHVADHRALFDTMSVDLGASTDAQRALDTDKRLLARQASGGRPDPELEASYVQFGRYLTVCGSRSSLPLNLQGLWIDRNDPAWMADYHTDINLQMNYWPTDRTGLPDCFDALADYCLAQVPHWEKRTRELFNDPRNGFRNTSGAIAGWTTAISTNTMGGPGWWWHPAGNAWLCNSLFEHYEFTLDRRYLAKILPLLEGACAFWEKRLVTTTVKDPKTGADVEVLVDDHDWSPEHGPTDARGITYAQELVWQLFENFRTATAALGTSKAYARRVTALQDRLYLPRVSPATGWLEEWMGGANLGETQHRHLSPFVGLFPGDRVSRDRSPHDVLVGVDKGLTARGMDSFGWACAWRALCWARMKDAEKAYQLLGTVLRPSVNHSNGTAPNFFDMYQLGGDSSVFQIDANFGATAAVIEMLLYSRPGLVELLPALPVAWGASGKVTGIGVRGGFTADLEWKDGVATKLRLTSTGGRTTRVRAGSWSKDVTLKPGASISLTPSYASQRYVLVNRADSRLAIEVSGTAESAPLVLGARTGGAAQQWKFAETLDGGHRLTNVHSGLTADVSGGQATENAPVVQYRATGADNQHWRPEPTDGGHVRLVCVRTGKSLGAAGGSAAAGAAVVQQTYTGAASQQWRRVAV
ncbi:glycoside hydrolase N-terminal domain-containing protein [Streptomyces sp. NPDC048527]|uniref:glycosyl hydrolase family 95 catalytic domain-containing protein n=1 Tax=Streptomyces sp. NPDC048527 TaxID=3365568 RepID=UPI00371B6519